MFRETFKKKIQPPALNANPLSEPLVLVFSAYEDVPIGNILPSYQLYELTFSKAVYPDADDYASEPPTYEDASPAPGTPRAAPPEPSFITWENSILANAHRLDRFSDLGKTKAAKVQVQIAFTMHACTRGREPVHCDPLYRVFLQGDSIHGYVLLENHNSTPVLFDMFLVVFEGRVSVNLMEGDAKLRPVVFYKFLNMFDYAASWTPAYFDRLSSEVDARDGTHVLFSSQSLRPGVKYKRFFNFTVPDRLLDCVCGSHLIPRHCQLLPTLGLDRKTFLHTEMTSADHAHKPSVKPMIHDFGFPGTSISYCVEALLVGKRSAYQKLLLPGTDEYVVIKEASAPVRVISRDMHFMDDDDSAIDRRFESLCTHIERILSRGRRLDSGVTVDFMRSRSISKHVYRDEKPAQKPAGADFEVLMPYKKKSLTNPKVMGMLCARFSRQENVVYFVPPIKFVAAGPQRAPTTLLAVPFSLKYTTSEDPKNAHPPDIKGFSAKLVVCTVRSNKYPIPVEFSQKMKFDNTLHLKDDFEKNVVHRFGEYLQELSGLISRHGLAQLNVDQQLLMDIKCLANLQVKSDRIKIGAECTGGAPQWQNGSLKGAQNGSFRSHFRVELNLAALSGKESFKTSLEDMRGSFCLVPSFESCHLARFYFVCVELKLLNGDTFPLKIPIRIQRC
ncbi:hypothetical protein METBISCDRAFT_17850 [Metschnikowia bicuspidata]|uniref:Bul1 N-terminal domain-containing protein n=1 Tax=Metschnikowia bicuspidata TaxID=27322 RepID=A0A4P9ZAE6_9ASCO|nr:hypothetical protein METBISCDRAFT_17850 [Metschnikowia bicuspidata]